MRSKISNIVHKSLVLISYGILLIAFLDAVRRWRDIPDIIGVHFSATGDFDVYASKWYLAYPFLVGFGMLIVLGWIDYVVKKIKSGLKISEEGERCFKSIIWLLTDTVKLCQAIFFAYWAKCVIYQDSLNTMVPVICVYILFAGIIGCVIGSVIIGIKYRVV